MSNRHVVQLDASHPGFRDVTYRQRRDAIAHIAQTHRTGDPVPNVAYTDDEQRVWRVVWEHLSDLHRQHVHPELVALLDALDLGNSPIPQFEQMNRALRVTGFRLEPVAGLVHARDFLAGLERGVFVATQYVRHPSRPLYTPEPDVVHELVGHVAPLMHPRFALLSRAFGRAARTATPEELERIIRVYWWTLEFGLVNDHGRTWAVGAGLLSSGGELRDAWTQPEWRDWDLDQMGETPYDPTGPNPVLFVAPSPRRMIDDLLTWLEGRQRLGPVAMPAA